MRKFNVYSYQQTQSLAEKMAKTLKSNIYALTGQLGAGKTTFTQGFAKGLGIKEKIISPTFILIRQHKIPNTKKMLFHIDLYRLENLAEIKSLGLDEILSNPNHIVVIEWAEKIQNMFPKDTTWIQFEIVNEDSRLISIINGPSFSEDIRSKSLN